MTRLHLLLRVPYPPSPNRLSAKIRSPEIIALALTSKAAFFKYLLKLTLIIIHKINSITLIPLFCKNPYEHYYILSHRILPQNSFNKKCGKVPVYDTFPHLIQRIYMIHEWKYLNLFPEYTKY